MIHHNNGLLRIILFDIYSIAMIVSASDPLSSHFSKFNQF